jgi:hypothetical protein
LYCCCIALLLIVLYFTSVSQDWSVAEQLNKIVQPRSLDCRRRPLSHVRDEYGSHTTHAGSAGPQIGSAIAPRTSNTRAPLSLVGSRGPASTAGN